MLRNYSFCLPFSNEILEKWLLKIKQAWPDLIIHYPEFDNYIDRSPLINIQDLKNINLFNNRDIQFLFAYPNERDYEYNETDYSYDDEDYATTSYITIVATPNKLTFNVPVLAKDLKQNKILLNMISYLREIQSEVEQLA